jgi:tRNA pseudouridine32 synthase/23S rRNA pseudouridine746 synthase
MSRPSRPPLPLRDGVGASCVAVPGPGWATVLDFLADRLPALPRAGWAARLQAGQVLGEAGQPLAASTPCQAGQRLYYWRGWADEPPAPEAERIVFQDDWLVVADKPHFMPVTPSGRFVQRSLLVRLQQRLGLAGLSPLHRIDRDTAGLVAFAVQPHTRGAYQALFRDRRVDKLYHAVAPLAPHLSFPLAHRSRLQADDERFFVSREVPGPANSETHVDLLHPLPAGAGGQAHGLYALRPVSGQRHQIRLHMAALGLPILGDAFYPQVLHPAGAPDDLARPLQLLACALAFTDPVTGQARHFTSRRRLERVPG